MQNSFKCPVAVAALVALACVTTACSPLDRTDPARTTSTATRSEAGASADPPGGRTNLLQVAGEDARSDGQSTNPSVSDDGRYVTFESTASNLVEEKTLRVWNVFLHDRSKNETTKISVPTYGAEANGESLVPKISGDGNYIAFESEASNLVLGDTNEAWDIFLYDREKAETTRISVATDGTPGNRNSGAPAISADGNSIAFHSRATNLVPDDTNDAWDVFVYDCSTGATTRVSVATDGTQGNDQSDSSAISDAGSYITYGSWATNLDGADTNGTEDIFLYDRSGQALSDD